MMARPGLAPRLRVQLLTGLWLGTGFGTLGCADREPVRASLSVAETLADADTAGFARATSPRTFHFPADHGPHAEYRHEWWYFTGNLESGDGRPFGFQLTFFRSALRPDSATLDSKWATSQAYMGHFALTDIAAGEFHAFERFDRGALGLAGAEPAAGAAAAGPVGTAAANSPRGGLRVWIGDWVAAAAGDAPAAAGGVGFAIDAAADGVALELALQPLKPVVLQGEWGLSRKGAEPGNASYYYSLPRLAARGMVTVSGQAHAVAGTAWLDREWGTSALPPGVEGWDWFALQLDDGSELMYYRLRREDGGTDPFSAGTLVMADGAVRRLRAGDVTLEETGSWTSPGGTRYPSGWRIAVPAADLALRLAPRLADQELDLAFRYWEGAVVVEGVRGGLPIGGVGYVELSGYAESQARY